MANQDLLPGKKYKTVIFGHVAEAVPAVPVLGSEIHLISCSRIVDAIENWIEARDSVVRRIIVTGFHGIWEAHRNAEYYSLANSADLWAADGIAPILVARIKGHRKIGRATGSSIMQEFFGRANVKGYRSFFYGDTQRTLDQLKANLSRDFPGHHIVGALSPPFREMTSDEDNDIIGQINAARPDVIWVGLGMPKQDTWIYQRRHRLNVPVAIGVGAAFGFLANTVKRCPDWIGKAGFEWLYRFWQEPRKLWRRDLLDGPRFLLEVGLEMARGKHKGVQSSSMNLLGDSQGLEKTPSSSLDSTKTCL